MDDDDWDIQAVVKGCAAATTNPSFSFADQINSFDFLTDDDDQNNIINDVVGPLFPGLQEAYGDLCVDPSATPAASFTGRADPARDEIMQIPKPAVQENIRFGCSNGIGSSSSSPSHNLQAQYNIRHRRRKNQQMKVVRQMTQEQLSADSWAWRKYGQKPIKGSPYPRNYYRCSTSKVCAARKQLERSPNDPGLFIVSYTGEHIHPRPTHRSSLAGSTRAKSSISAAAVIATNSNIDDNEILSRNKGLNSSSLTSTIFSPTIRPVASIKDEEEDDNDDDVFKEFDDHSSCDGNLFPIITSPP